MAESPWKHLALAGLGAAGTSAVLYYLLKEQPKKVEVSGRGRSPGAHAQPEAAPGAAKPLKVLELFAGIGGWRLALEAALPPGSAAPEVQAYDNAAACCEIYEHNFGEPLSRRNIEQLGVDVLDGFDLWVMSPPCQPFSTTREAKQRDLEDKRCKALEHLCDVIPRLSKPPKWIALENVKGFADSDACKKMQACLQEAGFTCQQLLLDLASFGTPNHRTRYYLLAERSERFLSSQAAGLPLLGEPSIAERMPHGLLARGSWAQDRRTDILAAQDLARGAASHEAKEEIFGKLHDKFREHVSCMPWALPHLDSSKWMLLPLPKDVPDAFLLVFENDAKVGDAFLEAAATAQNPLDKAQLAWSKSSESVGAAADVPSGRCISEFLESSLSPAEHEKLLVSREVLAKPYAKGLSYVEPTGRRSFCFTGHYGKVLHKSSGSMLHQPLNAESALDRSNLVPHHGAIRFFSPKEVINLLGFPADYEFPADMDLKHRYKAAGNSIAVSVCTELLRRLVFNEAGKLDEVLCQLRPSPDEAAIEPSSC